MSVLLPVDLSKNTGLSANIVDPDQTEPCEREVNIFFPFFPILDCNQSNVPRILCPFVRRCA